MAAKITRSRGANPVAAYMKSAPVLGRLAEVLGGKPEAARYAASVLLAVAENPALQQCAPESVFAAAMKAAVLRLDVSPQTGQAYLVPFRNKGRYVATLVVGYRGLVQMALRTGQYTALHAGPVYRGQRFVSDPLTGEAHIEGEPDGSGEVVGYVAYFRLRNGFAKAEYMSVEEIHAHAKRYARGYDRRDSAWQTNFDDMARKTVLRRLLMRWGPMNPSDRTALEARDEEYLAAAPRVVEVEKPGEAALLADLGFDTGEQPDPDRGVEVAVEDDAGPDQQGLPLESEE